STSWSRRDALAAGLAAPGAAAALRGPADRSGLVSWRAGTSAGTLRLHGDGRLAGFVIDKDSLEEALASGAVPPPPGVRALVVAGAGGRALGGGGGGPGALPPPRPRRPGGGGAPRQPEPPHAGRAGGLRGDRRLRPGGDSLRPDAGGAPIERAPHRLRGRRLP